MTGELTGSLPRLARFRAGPGPAKSLGRSSGQQCALYIGANVGLALALGRLAEAQHLPFTIFWSLQAVAEATLLSADAAVVDLSVWRELQHSHQDKLEALLSTLPLVVAVTEAEQAQLTLSLSEHVQVVVLPKSHAAPVVLQVVIRMMREANAKGAPDELVHPLHKVPALVAVDADSP